MLIKPCARQVRQNPKPLPLFKRNHGTIAVSPCSGMTRKTLAFQLVNLGYKSEKPTVTSMLPKKKVDRFLPSTNNLLRSGKYCQSLLKVAIRRRTKRIVTSTLMDGRTA